MKKQFNIKMSTFQFFVNGDWIEFDDFEIDGSLSHALRDRLGLTGTKIACGVSGCGSCTVLVSKFIKHSQKFRHISVNACSTPIYSVYGCHILTIEGVSEEKLVDPIQDALVRGNGTQCGFCSPGIVMSMFGLQKQLQREITMKDITTSLQGNLCRCTGYRPILEALKNCAVQCSTCTEPCKNADIEEQGGSKPDCKTYQKLEQPYFENFRGTQDSSKKLFEIEKLLTEAFHDSGSKSLRFQTPNGNWLVPRNLKRLKEIADEFKDAKIVGGSLSEGIRKIPMGLDSVDIIDISEVKELKSVQLEDNCLKLGAGLSLNEANEEVENIIKIIPEDQSTVLKCFKTMLETFGSSQIRNVATLGGNVAVPLNYSDLQTFCTGFDIIVSYLKLSDEDDDNNNQKVVSHITIPLTQQKETAIFEKISRRKDCDTAVLNMAIRYIPTSEELYLTFGGLSVKRFKCQLKRIDDDQHLKTIHEEVTKNFKSGDFHNLEYIQILAKNIFKKAVLKIKQNTSETDMACYKSTQLYPMIDSGLPSSVDLVHKAVPHASSYQHVTGASKFCDDIPKFHTELELAFVLSTKAHAKILNIDYADALDLEGVVGYVSSEDLKPGNNKFGIVERDEEIFASEMVTSHGQIIAGILALDRITARKASKLVKVLYEDIKPLILTNEDAIEHNSYYENYGMTLKKEDSVSPVIIQSGSTTYTFTNEVKIGSQEHFYMEPHSCISIPKEDGEMEIISSTQNPTGVQMEISKCLNIPANRITVKVRRVGGGFGGKEIRCLIVALPTAVAAKKFGRPVRCILDRETDMIATGKRHFYLARQKIVFNEDGKLLTLGFKVYANAGNSLDVSMAPIERILLNLDNAYNIPNIDMKGFVCKTNIPSNSVMRGTGAPQAAFFMENIMDSIAATLKKDPVEVRELQLYNEGDQTPYGQTLVDCNVRKCWDLCLKQSKYSETKLEIEKFNCQNQFVKRGISVNPCHFGVGYTALHLNQGSALVHIYTDGSVLITHGGVEIGQGVHSKMIQIATRELGVSASKIRISETSTDKVPNTTASSASVTSDLNGMAVMDACRQLVERLQPYWIKNPDDDNWENLISKAYLDRVNLSAQGFYKVPDMGWDGKKGNPWNYFSTGTACTIVELDCLTGRFQILKTDIVMDVGQSLNPSIDISQIEGAFVQGIGLFMLEEVIFNDSGKLLTLDSSTYKIPTASDIPLEFNVTLLSESKNSKAIYSSKTAGEPPLLLATSVFFAVKDAIRTYRKSVGASTVFNLDSPATIQSILMACQG